MASATKKAEPAKMIVTSRLAGDLRVQVGEDAVTVRPGSHEMLITEDVRAVLDDFGDRIRFSVAA